MEFIRQHKKISIAIMCCLFLFLFIGIAFGKYIYNVVDSYILETKGMYFNSSVLSVNTKEYKINNWDGVNSYNLTIDLNNRKNSFKKTDTDISYDIEVTCSNTVTCNLSKTSGIIYSAGETDSYQITVVPKPNFDSSKDVVVFTKVTSNSPYKKELSGRYVISVEKSMFSYNIQDNVGDNYFTLNLTNSVTFYEVRTAFGSYNVGDSISIDAYNSLSAADKAKCFSAEVTLTFDPNLFYLDMTSDAYLKRLPGSERTVLVDGYNYVSEFKFNIDATSSEKIMFYKVNQNQNYTYPLNNNISVVNVSVRLAGE